MADSYREDVAAYDNLRNRDADGNRDMGPQGGGPHPQGGGGGGKDKPEAWKPDNGDNITAGNQGGGNVGGGSYAGGSYSSGYASASSSGSGSSGAGLSSRDMRLIAQGENLYYQLWGEYPASGYVKALVKKGLNIFEIEDHERRKPAFKKSDVYQDEYSAYAKMIANVMGTR